MPLLLHCLRFTAITLVLQLCVAQTSIAQDTRYVGDKLFVPYSQRRWGVTTEFFIRESLQVRLLPLFNAPQMTAGPKWKLSVELEAGCGRSLSKSTHQQPCASQPSRNS